MKPLHLQGHSRLSSRYPEDPSSFVDLLRVNTELLPRGMPGVGNLVLELLTFKVGKKRFEK